MSRVMRSYDTLKDVMSCSVLLCYSTTYEHKKTWKIAVMRIFVVFMNISMKLVGLKSGQNQHQVQ